LHPFGAIIEKKNIFYFLNFRIWCGTIGTTSEWHLFKYFLIFNFKNIILFMELCIYIAKGQNQIFTALCKVLIFPNNVKENVPSNSSLKFVHDFLLEAQNVKRIFGDKSQLDFLQWLSTKCFEKSYSKWGLKFYFEHNSCFWLNYEQSTSY